MYRLAPTQALAEGVRGHPAPEARRSPRVRSDSHARTFINGLAYHSPERRVTNHELMERMDTSDEWIRDHTGIRERRYADAHVDTSDLGVIATREAMRDAGLDPGALDVLICATSTPDCLVPSTASYIANKLRLSSSAFDVNAACSGFVYGLAVARGLMHAQLHDRVALCTAEKYTRVIDPADRANSIFWGDGAGAVVLQPDLPMVGIEVVDVTMASRNEGADLVRVPVGGNFEMRGRAVKEIAFRGMVDSATKTLARHRLTTADLRAFVCHQANMRMIEALAERLGVEPRQHWHNVELFGNQGAAGVLSAFCAGVKRHAAELRDGDLFLLTVYGAGFTGGSALLRWVRG